MKKKILIIGTILGVVAAFKILGLDNYLTLDYLKASQESFQILYEENKITFTAGYVGIYILVTALSLPGAAILTLAGGGLFGFVSGTIIVSFASSIGATVACSVARFILRDWMQNKFEQKLSVINQGIENEGAFYLFSLRLIPVFPFFVINLVFGLTKIPLITFYWVSQVGMLLGTMVYINAGKELAKIDSLSGILSPSLILSFILLGIFPIVIKKALVFYRIKKE